MVTTPTGKSKEMEGIGRMAGDGRVGAGGKEEGRIWGRDERYTPFFKS
jgi:hypothetical protein